jgi:osmoprotectant transport system ATP-binding protein
LLLPRTTLSFSRSGAVTNDSSLRVSVKLGDRIAVLAEGGVLAQYDTPAVVLAAPADAFVADFVGSERGLRRLRVLTVDASSLVPASGFDLDALRAVPVGASLEDALAALLLDDAPAVAVVDASGDVLGVLTPEALHTAARRGA